MRRGLEPLDGRWYDGTTAATGLPELAWLQPSGHALSTHDWQDGQQRALAVFIGAPGHSAQPLLLLLNALAEDAEFTLPAGSWRVLIDSTEAAHTGAPVNGATWTLPARGLALLQRSQP